MKIIRTKLLSGGTVKEGIIRESELHDLAKRYAYSIMEANAHPEDVEDAELYLATQDHTTEESAYMVNLGSDGETRIIILEN